MNGDTDSTNLDEIFGPRGPLAQSFEGYQFRPEQLEMARSVERAIKQRRHVIIEAPTGLGKSFAYLIPGLLSGKRVIVATANKSLQNQLADKDVPNLIRALGLNTRYTIAKGRSNYICRYKWLEYNTEFGEDAGPVTQKDPLPVVQEIELSLEESGFTGDIEYLENPLPRRLAREIVSFPNDCVGGECRFARTHCYVDLMRQEAFQSQLIVTNHHLLLFSLKPQHEDQLLPEADVYIVDEAHNLEDAATLVFQTTINSGSLRTLLEGKLFKEALGSKVLELESRNRALFDSLEVKVPKDEPIEIELTEFAEMGSRIEDAAAWMESQPRPTALITEHQAEAEAEQRTACSALKSLSNDYQRMAIEDPEYVRYRQALPRGGVDFHRAPLRPASFLRSLLFRGDDRTVVSTSATLTTHNDFAHFKRQTGLPSNGLIESRLPHIFDYGRQALLFQPPMPRYDYQHPETYYEAAAEKVRSLLEVTKGNTLCLFTSWKGLNMVFDILSQPDCGVVWPIHSQGEDLSRRELLEWFQSTPHSVLCATRSFWEGIDVPGESLVSVVLDKLPFPNPNDPVHKQRMQLMDAEQADGAGPSSFFGYMLPHMAMTLKQGFGRLIRRMDDQGVVTVLDTRLENSRYGRMIRTQDLPPAKYTRRLEDVFRFLSPDSPDLQGRHVYALNISQGRRDGFSAQVEFAVPKLGLRDVVSMPQGPGVESLGHPIHWSLVASLRLLRERIEDKGGLTAESIIEIRCPAKWEEWVRLAPDIEKSDLVQELSLWSQVKWLALEQNC